MVSQKHNRPKGNCGQQVVSFKKKDRWKHIRLNMFLKILFNEYDAVHKEEKSYNICIIQISL